MWLDRQRSPVLAEGDEFACSALTVSTRLGRRLASAADAEARRQPISAETAFANVLRRSGLRGLELGGPRVYTYRSLLEVIALHLGKKPRLVPMPFGLWHALASVAEMLPEPPITRNQVELMQLDNMTSPGVPGFGDLRISSTSLEDTLPSIVGLSGGLPRVPPVP